MGKRINIDRELRIIQEGRYGEDVRYAIHDALDKINQNGGGGGGGSGAGLVGTASFYMRGITGGVYKNNGIIASNTYTLTIKDTRDYWAGGIGAIGKIQFHSSAEGSPLSLPVGVLVNTDLTEVPGYSASNVIDYNSSSSYWSWYSDGTGNDVLNIVFMFEFDEGFQPGYFSYVTSGTDALYDPTSFMLAHYDEYGQLVGALTVTDYSPPTARNTQTQVWQIR